MPASTGTPVRPNRAFADSVVLQESASAWIDEAIREPVIAELARPLPFDHCLNVPRASEQRPRLPRPVARRRPMLNSTTHRPFLTSEFAADRADIVAVAPCSTCVKSLHLPPGPALRRLRSPVQCIWFGCDRVHAESACAGDLLARCPGAAHSDSVALPLERSSKVCSGARGTQAPCASLAELS